MEVKDLHAEVENIKNLVFNANPYLKEMYENSKSVWDDSNPKYGIPSERYLRNIATVAISQGVTYLAFQCMLKDSMSIEKAISFCNRIDPSLINKAYSQGWVFCPGDRIGYWWHPYHRLSNRDSGDWADVESIL